jgi:lipopolysaccharide export system protein LptC
MNAAKQTFWLFLILIGLALSAWYFKNSTTIVKLDQKTLSHSPDTVITNLRVRRFDEQGQLTTYLQTPEMEHIPAENTHWLKTPQILVMQPGQPAWHISSRFAKAIHGGEQITFLQKVIVHQNRDAQIQESTMRTEELLYFPKDKLATSNLAVSFEQPGAIVHSKGMKAYLAEKKVHLLSKAHAIYDPKHG